MESVGIADLKARLSQYIAMTKNGEEILVTDRGRPVARLVPVGAQPEAHPAHLEEMGRRGELRIGPGGRPASLPPRPRGRASTLATLLAERRESER